MNHPHESAVIHPYGKRAEIPHAAEIGKYRTLDKRFRPPAVSEKDLFLSFGTILYKLNHMRPESNSEEPFKFLSEHFVIFENARDFVRLDDQKGWRMLLFCIDGRFQIEVNGTPYTIEPNDIAFCTPDKIVTRTMMSPDFKGYLFGCSANFSKRIFPNSADLWNKVFYMSRNFKIHLSDRESVELLEDYHFLKRKITRIDHLYYDEIIRCLLQAFLYQTTHVLDNHVEAETTAEEPLQSRHQICQAFIDLLSSTKPGAALGAMVCRAALQNSALSLDGGQARQRPKRFGMDSRSPDARGGRRAEKFPEKHQGDLRRARLSESFVLRPLCPSAVGMFAVRVPAAEKQSAVALSLRPGFRLKSRGIKQIIPHETAIIPEIETVVNQRDKFHTAKSESPIIDDYRALGIYPLNVILRQRSGFRTGRPFSSTARADVRPRWRNDEKDLLCTRHP